MKQLLNYILALSLAAACSYQLKPVHAQAQSVTPIEIGDANMLPSMKPTAARINVKRVYGSDLQFEYFWKPGTPTGVRTPEFIYKKYVILGTTSEGGYWTTPKIFIDAENILGQDSLLRVHGFLFGNGYNNRVVFDSISLVAERGRAIAAEATKDAVLTFSYGLNRTANNVIADTVTALASKTRLANYLALYQRLLASGTGISILGQSINNTAPDQVVSLIANGYGLSKSGTYPSFTLTSNTPVINSAPSITVPASTGVGTSGILSATNNARVKYTFNVSTSLSLVNLGSSAEVYLEISANGTTWTTIDGCKYGKTVTVGLVATDALIQNVSGDVPAGYYRRVRVVLTGGGTCAYLYGQEVTY